VFVLICYVKLLITHYVRTTMTAYGKGKIWPLDTPKPLNRSLPKFYIFSSVITSETPIKHCKILFRSDIGSRPSDHYFRSVCLSVCLFVCEEFFSAVFDPIWIKLGHMLYVWV